MKAIRTSFLVTVVAGAVTCPGCDHGPDLTADQQRAVRIALAAIGPDHRIPNVDDVEVVVSDQGDYVVTWPVRRTRPTRGPDFYVRVHVDLASGVATRLIAGN